MKKLLLILTLPLISLMIISVPTSVSAASSATGQARQGLCELNAGTCSATVATSQVNGVAKTAINILSLIVGIASVVVIIISGFRFITSSGDSNTISSARTQLIYAIIGIIIVAIAQLISRIALSTGNKINGITIVFPHFKI